MIAVPPDLSEAIRRFEEAGEEAYLVGGCLRDALMGRTPHDFDLAVSAAPEKTADLFADRNVIRTGIRHGTVTVSLDRQFVEMTTFRTESGYSDGRHPDSVSFSRSICEDLSRRDFTINAMAYSSRTGLIDPFGGRDDLKRRVIRCVGDPDVRFSEDALRLLRAFRFASVLDFEIETETARAMRRTRERLKAVSGERIAEEIKKAVVGPAFGRLMSAYTFLVTVFWPELAPAVGMDQQNPHHTYDLLTHLVKTVDSLPADPILRIAGLLHDVGKPPCRSFDADGVAHYYRHASVGAAMAEKMLTRLHFSRTDTDRIVRLIRFHDGVIEPTESAIRHRLNQLGPAGLSDLLSLQQADRAARGPGRPIPDREDVCLRGLLNDVLQKNACFKTAQLAVNGHDLMAEGLFGPAIGRALDLLLEAVMNGETENEKTDLIAYLRKQGHFPDPQNPF